MNVHFSSASDEWETPQAFYETQNTIFGPFTLDPCATAANAKCTRFFTREDDGLKQPWAPHYVWMNPPYGRAIGQWMRKAHEEAALGAKVVCLVPARTDTAWWHDYAMRGEIILLRGRLTFGRAKHPAPFPSALIIFYPKHENDNAL